MRKINPNLIFFLEVILITILFFIKSLIFLDPDFGWHLKMGELILTKGIPKTDPFSYTMPSYPFVDHEWLTNIIMFKIYSWLGITGLALVFSLIAGLVLAFIVKPEKRQFSLLPLLLGGSVLLVFGGIRLQMVSWLFIVIFYKTLVDSNGKSKLLYFLPLVILFWVNLHGSFPIGILFLLIYSLFQFLSRKKLHYNLLLILALSILITFINPYGYRIWWEVWMTISDTSLKWNIVEWFPGIYYLDFAYLFLLALFIVFGIRYRKKIDTLFLIFSLFFLLFAFSSTRHVPIWIIIAIPLVAELFYFFYADISKNKISLQRFKKIYPFFILIILIVFIAQIYLLMRATLFVSEKNFYPQEAINYLNTKNIKGNIFSVYGWGGYLIWKYPDKKVFIDGRMPSWRRANAPVSESNYAFFEYQELFKGNISFKQLTNKYDIKVILLPRDKKEENILTWFLRKFYYVSCKKEDTAKWLEQIAILGFKVTYIDSTSVIYVK